MRIMDSESSSNKTDLGNALRNKIRIRNVEMEEEMKQDAIDVAIEAIEEYSGFLDIATYIRTRFMRKHGGIWSCIVGNQIGISVCLNGHSIHLEVDMLQPMLVIVLWSLYPLGGIVLKSAA